MFQDFAKKKFNDYLALLEFPAGRISFQQLRTSTLPPFIINFVELYVPKKNAPVNKKDFEDILQKAIVFNINYIIRPKNTVLKFLFGELETRPVPFIKERLKYFQFYGYYITQIVDFISVNSLEVISINQAEHLINDINRRLYEEIGPQGDDSQRMNLVKLLYYFFHDLGENNPINIKIPKKILSAFFQDKGYYDIKKRVDAFFSDEIFIQEALELMNPMTKKAPAPKSDLGESEEKVKEFISKAKEVSTKKTEAGSETETMPAGQPEKLIIPVNLATSLTNREVEKILKPEENVAIEIPSVTPEELRERESLLPAVEKSRLVVDEDIYSDDLVFASHFSSMAPPAQLTEKEIRTNIINELFCEQSYRKKIVKRIFRKNEDVFFSAVNRVLDAKSWNEASEIIEAEFTKNKVDYFSDEAVKFVDIMQSHFIKE